MAIASALDLYESLRTHGLLEPAQLAIIERSLQGKSAKSLALARELLRKGWLTEYQKDVLLDGRGAELVLGEYTLLEKLGEGAMGKVFKARHRLMDRIVAIKVIRQELTENRDAVRRFESEIRLAAKLDHHAHLVHALHAAHVGDTYFLVMEYVEGTSLERIVQQSGRQQVRQACDFVRQAALGLQHASKLGLVHRDIKPSNLQLTAQGTSIKVIDMGLARLTVGDAEKAQTTITQKGWFLGTPDFIAPEQIADPSQVDARADIYSLGCTLYFLLAGHPPFPVGAWDEKLVSHRKLEPQPIEQLRPDVPAPVAAVLRKMMAKRPEDRYGSPAAVADALAPFSQPGTPPPASMPGSSGQLLTQPTECHAGRTPSTTPTVISTEPITSSQPPIPVQAPSPNPQSQLGHSQPPPLLIASAANFRGRSRFWVVRAGGVLLALGILSMLVFWLKGDSKPFIDENFRDAYERKSMVPEGWEKGKGFRIDKDKIDQTFLGVPLPPVEAPRVIKLPAVHLNGNFYIEGGFVLSNLGYSNIAPGTLSFVLEGTELSRKKLAVTFHLNGGVGINGDFAMPVDGYRAKVPFNTFRITRKGTEINVLLNDQPACAKDVGTVADFETIKLEMSAGSSRLYQLTVGAGDPEANPARK